MALTQQMDLAAAMPAYVLLAVLAIVVVLLTVVAIVTRAVMAKAPAEDLQHILPGLSQVLAALALFLPWGRGTRGPTVTPPVSVRPPRRGGGRRHTRG
ncbi:hypothetical protein [Streptomyces alanosinicus]|uniref:Uncharacterized protein n=1 Tax=Streptomyces alanosinicus TaxID=68171 RepID=A0A918YNB6_9ACTN|nr:hypothetical protein [Streptomyces alanosinicus]GHE09035.1 hypothetical protein GCM10010339_60010 [Streptomyces alanosinicus]